MKAIIIQEEGKAEIVDVNKPSLRPDYIMVKPVAVALNPTDWKHIDGLGVKGGRVGCDYSGIVEEVGEACKQKWSKGDKIFGVCHGANQKQPEDGAFAEYVMQKDGLSAKIPENLSYADAATFGVGLITIGQGLYQSMKLPLPPRKAEEKFPILIYGGSSATGTLAIQYARLSGLTVLATASPRNFDLLKSLGADAVFDYNDPECGQKIRSYTNNNLRYVFDTITLDQSFRICEEALASDNSGGELHYSALLPIDGFARKDVNARWTLAYTTFGEAFDKFGASFPVKPEDHDFAAEFWSVSAKLIAEGSIKPHPAQVGERGLEGVLEGLQAMRENKVSGNKLVYVIADTPGL